MESHKGKPDKKPLSFDFKNLQNPPGDGHAQTGVKKSKNLQIFKGQILGDTQEDIELQPQKRNDVVQRRVIIGKKLIGIDIREPVKLIDIFNITDMPGIDKVRSHAGICPGVMLAFIKS